MNFNVFESLAGSVLGFQLGFGMLFIGILFWRLGASIISSFRQLSDGEIDVDDWLWSFLKVTIFVMFCGVFLYLT